MGDTVWLSSYPKSGNTWFRAVLTAWLRLGSGDMLTDLEDLRSEGIASWRGRLDGALGLVSTLLTDAEIARLRPVADDVIDAAGGERLPCKVHDAFRCGDSGMPAVSVAATRGAVYVVRDPRDVAVSWAHHNGWTMERAVAVMNDAEFAVGGSSGGRQVVQRLGRWSDHVVSWLDETPFDVHVVRYEDCVSDPVATFGSALAFLGHRGTTERLEAAVEATSFQRLRAIEDAVGFSERPPASDRFFRRGRPGAWRDELPGPLAASLRGDHGDVMDRFRYR
ncbi:MAG: sulfotransferase domain-containing protein [Acidimicrobiales bacterium]